MALTFSRPDLNRPDMERARAALALRLAERHRPVDAGGARLWVHDAFKVYRQGEVEAVVLRGAELRVQPGEFLAIVGRSGVGKTTLLNLIGGLDTPTAGQIVIDNVDLAHLDETERAAFRRYHLGIVYQEANLLPYLTAEENVSLPLRLAGRGSDAPARARALLDQLGLGHRRHHRPAQLSGGEAQRVAIAVALALQPQILLADELTGELDTETAEEVLTLLRFLNREEGLTLVIVTHSARVAGHAERTVRLTDGILQAEERP